MAATVINTAQIMSALRPGLSAMFSDSQTYPDQWKDIFAYHTSDKSAEYDVEMKLLSIAKLKTEGGSVSFDGMRQMFVTPYIHQYVGMGFIITRQALMDNLYKDAFPKSAVALKDSLREFKNTAAANVFNNGFSTSYPIGDGQPLYSLSHPIEGGTVANTLTVQTQLNESSLEDALIQIQQFKNAANLFVGGKPRYLLVPPQQQFIADILLNSRFRTSTANNDLNPINSSGLVRDGFRVNNYLTNSNFWALINDHSNGFKYFEREGLNVDQFVDIDTDNLKVRAIERYSFGCSDFRATFGSGNL